MKMTECIEEYVNAKRAAGVCFNTAAGILKCFAKNHRDKTLDEITEHQVVEFLDLPLSSDVNWQNKYGTLKGFFEYWKPRCPLQAIPMPKRRRYLPTRYLIPHIYLTSEVEKLIGAIRNLERWRGFAIDPLTYRTFILVIYGTGCSTGEARSLPLSSVDLKRGELAIHSRRRVRRIPLCAQLQNSLRIYIQHRMRGFNSTSTNLFLTKTGGALPFNTIYKMFRRIRKAAAILTENDHTPTLRDFRPTFAVQRLSEWHKRGLDLEKMVPALAAYMGYSSWSAIERYLRFTPEHFRKQMNMLSSNHAHRHWRDNASLMRFLSSL
jgi:integrase